MKTATLLCGSLLALAFSCGGRAYYGAGDGGTEPSSGTGGSSNTGGYPNTGGYARTGGSLNTGGYWLSDGGSLNTGGYWLSDGGSLNTGGYWLSDGGSLNTGGYWQGGTLWALPVVQPICDGVMAPPAVVRWVDDFEGGSNVFNPVIIPAWEVYADVEETILGGQGIALATPLAAWGSHDPASAYGMQMQGYVSSNPVGGKNSWGADWMFETDWSIVVNRPSMDLRAYTGMVIWARLAGVPGKGNMVIAFPTSETTIGSLGGDGSCETDAGMAASCYAHFQTAGKVTKTCWSPINIPFSVLKTPYGNTPPAGFDKAHVFGIDLEFSAWATAIKANWPVDVIIDDVYLY